MIHALIQWAIAMIVLTGIWYIINLVPVPDLAKQIARVVVYIIAAILTLRLLAGFL